MTVKTKAVNYTPDMITKLKADYVGQDNKAEVAALAKTLGKNPNSIVAKLSSLGIYKRATVKTVAGKPKYTKAMRAEKIVSMVPELKDIDVESLEKTSVRVLQALENVLGEQLSETL